MDDVRAVMDAVDSERAALLGVSEGGPMSDLFAATYPERTSALVLYGSHAHRAWAAGDPSGRTEQEWRAIVEHIETAWAEAGGLDSDMWTAVSVPIPTMYGIAHAVS